MPQSSDQSEAGVWHRVFARSEVEPDPEALCAAAESILPGVLIHRHDGERGWERLELTWPSREAIAIDRFWRDEEGIRAELQAWAAWLESVDGNPHSEPLMLHLTQTQQVFTFSAPECGETGRAVARLLGSLTDSVYEIDGRGFFSADGKLLLAED